MSTHGGEAAVEVRALSRRYPGLDRPIVALREVTASVERSEMVAVMGPSGSGKTTLLNLIAGLDRPTSGEVTVLGRALNVLSERQLTAFRASCIGFIFQDPHLLPGLTAWENVVVRGLPWRARGQLATEARALLEAVGMREREDFPPSKLSGGERQRVGIARALLGHPPVLLADEPTGNLDEAATRELLSLVADLRRRFDLTVIVATHDEVVAEAADRVEQLWDGEIHLDPPSRPPRHVDGESP